MDQPDAALADFSGASHPPEKKRVIQAVLLAMKIPPLLISPGAVNADVTAVDV